MITATPNETEFASIDKISMTNSISVYEAQACALVHVDGTISSQKLISDKNAKNIAIQQVSGMDHDYRTNVFKVDARTSETKNLLS